MSRLQSSMRSLPECSVVTKELQKDQEHFNSALDKDLSEEVLLAKRMQAEIGCTWPQALRQASADLQSSRKNH